MKQFFLKLGLMTVLVFSLCYVSRLLTHNWLAVPYCWNDSTLGAKQIALQNAGWDYNMYFLGTSRMYRGINPEVVKNTVKEKGKNQKLKAFNFGFPGAKMGALRWWVKHISDKISNPNKQKYIVLELVSVRNNNTAIADNGNIERNRYWINFEGFWANVKMLMGFDEKSYSNSEKGKALKGYFRPFLKTIFNLGGADYATRYRFVTTNLNKTGANRDGYLALEKEKDRDGKVAKKHNGFLKRANEVAKDKKNFNIDANKSLRNKKLPPLNEAYYEAIMNLIEYTKAQNIHLVVVTMPYTNNVLYEEVLPVFEKLPRNHKIDLANANKHPELYAPNLMYDVGHSSIKGAKVLSKEFAKEFAKLNKRK
ncbi:MAG: hypothetical protein ACPGXL_10590 [Chitinophagales bacterium]